MTLVALSMAMPLLAQESADKRTGSAYRAEIVLRDSETGQKPNLRRFALLLDDNGKGSINTGSRRPYRMTPPQWQFVDVGLNLNCRVREAEGQLKLWIDGSVTDVTSESKPEEGMPPVVGQHRFEAASVVTAGKPAVVLAWDEPNGKRRYELEITVHKLR